MNQSSKNIFAELWAFSVPVAETVKPAGHRFRFDLQGRLHCGAVDLLPEGCTVLQNDNGTAPGCAFQAENGCTVIMLPGPPSELAPMLENYAVPYLKKSVNSVIVSHNVHILSLIHI